MTHRVEHFTRARLDGLRLRVVRHGPESNPPLVLLHGAGANAHWWDHLAPTLARSHHVVALDFRGHGDSDYPPEVEAGGFNEDLAALLEHLAAPEAILVGHSMGGHVALEHAARTGRPRALVLIDVSRGAAPTLQRHTRRALSLRRTYKSRDHAISRFRFVPSATGAEERLRHAIADHSVRSEPEGRWGFKVDPRWFALPPRPDPDLGRVRCPVLLIRGADSTLLTPEGAHSIISGLPRGRLVEIAGAGHHVHLDRPDEVLGALGSFLAEQR